MTSIVNNVAVDGVPSDFDVQPLDVQTTHYLRHRTDLVINALSVNLEVAREIISGCNSAQPEVKDHRACRCFKPAAGVILRRLTGNMRRAQALMMRLDGAKDLVSMKVRPSWRPSVTEDQRSETYSI
jgi:hypothetical protein